MVGITNKQVKDAESKVIKVSDQEAVTQSSNATT